MAKQSQVPASSPPADRLVSVPLLEYLAKQNEIANHIRGYQQMATTLLSHITQQAAHASQAMSVLQETTRQTLEANGMSPLEESLSFYPSISALLKLDKAEIANYFGAGLSNMPTIDLPGLKIKKPKKPRKQKPVGAPRRPQTAFFLFQADQRDKYKAQMMGENPEIKPGDVQKRLTETWNNMTSAEQQPYKDRYAVTNEEYVAAKKKFEAERAAEAANGALSSEAGVLAPDADGDAESSNDSTSSEESSDESETEPLPPPPPVVKTPDKSKKSKATDNPKRKHQEVTGAEIEPVKESKKSKKSKKNEEQNIDPELRGIGKEKKQKRKSKAFEEYGEDF